MNENCDNNEPSNRTKYQYDAGGDVTQITYPSGRIVQQVYNAIGQLCEIAPSASGCSDSTYYAGGFSYNAPGKLTGFTYGNGVTETSYYSPDRTQLTYLAYAKGTSTYFNLQYSYQQSSPYSPPCPTGTAGDNGSIQCITDSVDQGRSTSFNYDPLSRMASAKTCGSSAYPQWGLAESYDRFGNRWTQSVTAGSGPSTYMSFNGNNQPVGYTYDSSGNMTVEPGLNNDMTYDGENRMTAFQGFGGAATYSYDGNGLRVIKSVQGGTTTVNIFSGDSVIAEYDNSASPSSPSREYIYNPASLGDTTHLLARISGGTTTYYHQDHLSVRLTTDANGNVVAQQGAFPFGESWYTNLGSGDNWIFTSYNRDTESGLDYALARYYDSRTGTFCSADPLAGDPSDPQSWNRYPYGRNNPIMITDPSGQNWFFSLMQDIGIALSFFPPTAPMGIEMAGMGGTMNAFDNLANGQPPWGFGSFGGGMALGSSWNGTPIMQYPGLTAGLQGALGLPTMADEGPIFDAQDGAVQATQAPIYCQPDVIAAMKKIWAQSSNGTSGHEASFILNGSPENYRIAISPYTNEHNSQRLTIQGNTWALFHVHPNNSSWEPSTPGNNAENNGLGDTGVADKYNLQMYVVSSKGLGFYNPATKKPSVLLRQGLDWTKPCPHAQ